MTYAQICRRIIPNVDFHQNNYARALESVIARGVDWLDVGAGTKLHDGYGVTSNRELAERARSLVGIDPVVDHLRENPYLTSFAAGYADKMPFPDDSFDVVSANMVLEHLEQPQSVFSEVSRVLRPGGTFVFVTPNVRNPVIWMADKLLSQKNRSAMAVRVEGREAEHVFPTFYRANSVPAIAELARRNGLSVDRLGAVQNIPFIAKPVILTALECVLIRAMSIRPLLPYGADLIGVLRKR